MTVQRSKHPRKFFHFLLCVVAMSVRSVNGEATLSGPYPAAITPDANYRGYGSDLANRGYSITPAALAYHSNDPVSSVLSQVRDDDDVTLISPLARSPQSPPAANLVRYIILKEYHVLRDGTMIPAASDTIIGKTDGTPQISPLGGYSSSSDSSYGPPPASSGYSSPSAPSGESSGYSSPSGSTGTASGSGYSEIASSNAATNQRPSARRPNLDDPVIEITRVELPEESDEPARLMASATSENGGSGRKNNDEDSSTNEVNDDGDSADGDDGNDNDDDNVDDIDDNDDDDGGEQDENDDEDDEENDSISNSKQSNSPSSIRTQSSSGNQQRTNNNRPPQQAQSGNANRGSSSGSSRNSAGGGGSGNSNDSRFQVTPIQGVVLGNRNPPANRPQPQSSNTRGQSSSVLTDAFMFSEPSAEIIGSSSKPSTGTSNTNSNRNSNSRRNNNSSRNRIRNNRNRNRNRSRNNRRRNRNRVNATTTASPPPIDTEELAPIVLPTSASPQLQEALQLVAQFAQQQADLLSRTKQQAKSIAGSVFNKLTIPGLGFGSGGNASAPYPQSQSLVSAQEVSITKLREIDPANNTDTAKQSSSQLPQPSTADQPPEASVSSPQTTYGAPGGGYGFHATNGFNSIHQAKANIHQQLAGLKSGFKAGILSTVQNTVAAVHSKGETGTSTTSPSPIYGAPAPAPTFQIFKAVKGHFISKGKGVANHFVNKGQRVVGHFTNKGTQFVGHFANKGRTVKNHFVHKGARLTQKASTLVDAKHMHLQNVIKHIQTIFQHNPALTAW